MPSPLQTLLRCAEAVAFTIDLGCPILLQRREDELYLAVIEWRVSQRASLPEVASALSSAAGRPGSIGLAAASIRRRCRQ